MTGQWRDSTRKARLPPDWPRIRARILKRDGHRCTWVDHGTRCTTPATDVDHVIAGDDHRDANLRSLCQPHHRAKSSSEGHASRKPRKRQQPKHPGLT